MNKKVIESINQRRYWIPNLEPSIRGREREVIRLPDSQSFGFGFLWFVNVVVSYCLFAPFVMDFQSSQIDTEWQVHSSV